MTISKEILDEVALSEKEYKLVMLKLGGNDKLIFELTLEGWEPVALEEDLFIQLTGRLGAQQIVLVKDITEAIERINSLNPVFFLKEVDKEGQNLTSLQKRALVLQQCFYEPNRLLTEEEKKRLNGNEQMEIRVLGKFATMDKRNYEEWNRRIFTLLEHFERRLADKRSAVNFNRTVIISLISICIAIISLVLNFVT
jgi:hypothetical protein